MTKMNKDLINQLVELFKMEPKKYEQFNKMMKRTELLTSECGFTIEKTRWNNGGVVGRTMKDYLIYELKGTRSAMRIVVDMNVGDDETFKIIRKTRGLVKENWSQYYNALGYEIWELM